MRLRRWFPSGPAIRRVRRGRGFSYFDDNGQRVTDQEVLERISALTIPPAWRDVRICPWPHGHLQAVGTDDAGRRQYIYHEAWRARRDREKFDRMRSFARRLPVARERFAHDLATRGLNRTRVLAAAARMLDIGFFRVGGEEYAEDNGSYGLATVLREHVHVARGGAVVFDYPAKWGIERVQAVADPAVVAVLRALMRRRREGEQLLAYYERPGWKEVRSEEINAYLHDVFGDDVSAKDFRTWHGTVLAAVCLAAVRPSPASRTARKRARSQAMREVAEYLGNTPAVCRTSYVDPAIIDAFEQGDTVEFVLEKMDENGALPTEGAVEQAVLDLLENR